ncbi:MAG: ABC transporter substrate-binding protein [Thermoplasmata archaeon]
MAVELGHFHLRDDVKFHSGRDLQADDVLYSMERYVRMASGFGYLFNGSVDMSSSEAVDDHTVQFELTSDFGAFEYKLSRFYIFDKEAIQEHSKEDGEFSYPPHGDFARDWLKDHDAGSGPYELKEITQDHVIMTRFKDYWGPMHDEAADEVRMLALAEPSTERTMFASDELEVTSEWIPERVKELIVDNEGGVLGTYKHSAMPYILMHCRKKPLDDVHVRKALAYTLDYETATDDILPAGTTATGIISSTLAGAAKLDMPIQDLDKAEEELKKSEYYPDIVENPEEYEIEFAWNAAVSSTENLGLLLAGDAEEIGLNFNPVKYTYGELVDMMRKQATSPDMVPMFNSAQYGDAGSLIEAMYGSSNAQTTFQNSWLLNDTLDKRIENAMNETDEQERFTRYKDLQEEILQMYPAIYTCDLPSTHVYQPYVDWPAMESENNIPDVQYYFDCRKIGVTPIGER